MFGSFAVKMVIGLLAPILLVLAFDLYLRVWVPESPGSDDMTADTGR